MILAFCGCDEPVQKPDEDTFPSADQIWGMIGTVVATVACWIAYAKVKLIRERHREPPHRELPNPEPKRMTVTRRGRNLIVN